ncbi:ABC transporter ATP-binding protein/permease [Acidaminobacter sp. JC074]|uniref:ABC transporter ATP-binding protein/permease n=1 Tax=Acidaminobacter sp. JC074 TaxID=2530199 RepID=UPI001F0E9158|nr:ABC transporter ATP-binding protein/permease [Acidaminobacter sp. JC074]MCH4890877.1 ABC transporter ATP-binding protein/permease [Acidaminobacter sp. JC074]
MVNDRIIELRNVSKTYQSGSSSEEVLKDVCFSFKKGLNTSILGASGCGKTTLLRIMGGVDSDFEGDLLYMGQPIKDFDKYRRENVSFIFQDLNLIPHLNLVKNITLALTNDVLDKKKRALDLLDKVGLKDHSEKFPHQLSGGERQRVAIARALARDTEVLFCDEPTGSLDKKTKKEIMDLIVQVFHDKTLIFITHDTEVAEGYSDIILNIVDKDLVVMKTNHSNGTSTHSEDAAVSGKTFKKRFEFNLLANELTIFNASYLFVIIASIFIFATGIIEGVETEIDNYLYEKYSVDKILVKTPNMTYAGFQEFIASYNQEHNGAINAFMAALPIQISNLSNGVYNLDYRMVMVQASDLDSLEKDILIGRLPEKKGEVLYSKESALKLVDECIKNKPKLTLDFLSDEDLLNEIQKLELNYYKHNRRLSNKTYSQELKIVGLINDSKYWFNPSTLNSSTAEKYKYRNNLYVLEEEFNELLGATYFGAGSAKFSEYSLSISGEDLDMRQTEFNNFLNHKDLMFGKDYIMEERDMYYNEIKAYKIAIISGCWILFVFAMVSVYNGIRTSIAENRRNIGIYKSLGYTSTNIKSMFLKEGLILIVILMTTTMILWSLINVFINEAIVKSFDPYRIIESSSIVNLNTTSAVLVLLMILTTIVYSINRELRNINLLELLRNS